MLKFSASNADSENSLRIEKIAFVDGDKESFVAANKYGFHIFKDNNGEIDFINFTNSDSNVEYFMTCTQINPIKASETFNRA